MIQFNKFEKMPGGAPYRLLEIHPTGKYIAMQAKEHRSGRSAVWEEETGQIVWKPDRAIALAWLRGGMQIGVLREASNAPYEFAIYTWPETQMLHSCSILPPPKAGWMIDLVISPQNDLALCHWVDQSETGFEFIDITPQNVFHASQASYSFDGTNDTTRAVFSPSGHFWAFGYKMYEVWWAQNPEDIDTYDQPAIGGNYQLGELLIFQKKILLSPTIPLVATLPAGWLPKNPDADDVLYIGDPVFLDDEHIQIRLPSGEVQIHLMPIR